MQIDIDDATLAGFNTPARTELKKATLQFADDLLAEANRIEASRNPTAGTPQVTSRMILKPPCWCGAAWPGREKNRRKTASCLRRSPVTGDRLDL